MPSAQHCEGANCLLLFFKSIINTFVVSAENIGVIPWCLFWWFVWYAVHKIYNSLFESILKRTTIREEKYKLLIKLYWQIAFASLSIPFALQNLQVLYIDVSDRFYYVLENHISRWFNSDLSTLQIKLTYVILSGFYLNNISEACFEFGLYSKEFILNELFGLFFIATCPLKCVQFGMAVIILVNIVDCFIVLTSVFVVLGDIAQSVTLKVIISHICFVIHVVLWLFIYLYMLPVYFMRALFKKLNLGSDAKQLSMFFLLNCAFLAYYILYLILCPVSNMIYHFVLSLRPPITVDYPSKFSSHIESENIMEEMMRNREVHKNENLRMMYQTVKCVIRMRRKLTKIRQAKLAKTLSDPSALSTEVGIPRSNVKEKAETSLLETEVTSEDRILSENESMTGLLGSLINMSRKPLKSVSSDDESINDDYSEEEEEEISDENTLSEADLDLIRDVNWQLEKKNEVKKPLQLIKSYYIKASLK